MSDPLVEKFAALKAELKRDGLTPEMWARARLATQQVLAAEDEHQQGDDRQDEENGSEHGN